MAKGRPRKPLRELSPAYRKRLKAGMAKGLSRSQAYGHPTPHEAPASAAQGSVPLSPKLATLRKSYRVAERMRQGDSMTRAAKTEGIGVATLKRWMPHLGFMQYDPASKRYAAVDTVSSMEVSVEPGKLERLTVDRTTASLLADYLNTAMLALKNNDANALKKYARQPIHDVQGHRYLLVTDLDTLIVLERERKRRNAESQAEGRNHRISERVTLGGQLAFSK